MIKDLYYWANNVDDYISDICPENGKAIKVKRINLFIGKNNAGKSRFLRNLFQSEETLQNHNFPDLRSSFSELKKIVVTHHNNQIWENNTNSTDTRQNLINLIEEMESYPIFPKNDYEIKYTKIIEVLSRFTIATTNKYLEQIRYIKNIVSNYYAEIRQLTETRKYYIPVLRGMRPVTDQQDIHPYILRAKKDYFSTLALPKVLNIVTGELFYNELKIHLLGEPEQRDLIKTYEEKLSQYFFDNEKVSLIPKHDQDVVNIKIGNAKQFPIYQLGDGLQQVIILTYEAFINKDEIHYLFIEEPELHMHAGMVRQVMNFYLNETNHYYFFTTHSNHLLDMAHESNEVIVQKFVKEFKQETSSEHNFFIYQCNRDRDLLASLGVKPSSVYLANCTIWVEGITDRLYITKYMEKYLDELYQANSNLYKKYRRFMPNYHYTFVEYAGSNLVHWSFSDDKVNHLDNKGLSARAVASDMLLIADGDIQNKGGRVEGLNLELNQKNFLILECKETENTLPKNSIIYAAEETFEKMRKATQMGFDINKLYEIENENYFFDKNYGIGRLLDNKIKNVRTKKTKTAFADGTGVGTIKNKLAFCRKVLVYFDQTSDWKLTPEANKMCKKIFEHIEKCNA